MNPNQNLSVPQFETVPPQESRHNKKRIARLVSEVTLASLVIAGGVACGTENGTETKTPEITEVAPEINSETMDAMGYQSFTTLETASRADHYAQLFDEQKDKAWSIMRKYMTPTQDALVKNNFPTDKAAYTDQDILNRYAIDTFDASVQGSDPEDINKGRKMHSVIMDPSNPNFTRTVELIGNGQGGVINVMQSTGPDYPRIKNTTFRGHAIGENGAEIIYAQNINDGTAGYALFTLIETPEGATVWQHTDQFATTDMSIQHDIAQAIEKSHS